MSGFSPDEISILGEKSPPWFDPDWPWNLGRVARFCPYIENPLLTTPNKFPYPIIEIDFSKGEAVAMWGGCKMEHWEPGHPKPQQILVRYERQWLVLVRICFEISEKKAVYYSGGDWDKTNKAKKFDKVLYQYAILGAEGDRSERVFASTDGQECKVIVFNPAVEPFDIETLSDEVRNLVQQSDRFSVKCFAGECAVKNAVDHLAYWGFVQSKYWPAITSRFPELNELQDYLISLDYLYPDGSHPLHGKTSNVLKQSSGSDDADGLGLGGPLSNNDRSILQFMYTQKIDAISPMPSADILKGALYIGNDKDAFDNLRELELVDARTNVGRWLTDKGWAVAKEVVDRLGN